MNIYKQSSLAAYLIIETLNTFSGASRVWGILPIHNIPPLVQIVESESSVSIAANSIPVGVALHQAFPFVTESRHNFLNCRGKWRKASVW